MFQIYQDEAGLYRWRLVNDRNKKITAEGGEGYDKKSNCRRAVIRHVQTVSLMAMFPADQYIEYV